VGCSGGQPPAMREPQLARAMNRKSGNGHAPAMREPRFACAMNRKSGNRRRCSGACGELGTGREREGIGLGVFKVGVEALTVGPIELWWLIVGDR